jgi:hypothetical protein
MQKDEPRAVRVEQQVVEVVLRPGIGFRNLPQRGDLGQRDDLPDFTALEVDRRDAGIVRGEFRRVRVGQPDVSSSSFVSSRASISSTAYMLAMRRAVLEMTS